MKHLRAYWHIYTIAGVAALFVGSLSVTFSQAAQSDLLSAIYQRFVDGTATNGDIALVVSVAIIIAAALWRTSA